MQRESCKNIECRVARIATDHGRKTGCLLKLYRNGVELPTARQIWIDFVVTNDETTPYIVKSCTEINGTAYDVTITDTKGLVFYDGWKRRMRQTDYARKHNLEVPADTIAIEKHNEELRSVPCNPVNITRPNIDIVPEYKRNHVRRFLDNNPDSLWFRHFNHTDFSQFTNDEIREIYSEIRPN